MSAGPATAGATSSQRRRAVLLGGVAIALLVATPAAGESAATPPIGPDTALPPWSLAANLPSGVVTAMLIAAYLLAAAAVWLGLRAIAAGWRPAPRRVALLAAGAVIALVLVPPFGSADHLSYAAYGRIAAQGGDPYLVAPDHWLGGLDPVVSGARPPWRDTTTVYGPVATALQAVTSRLGGDSLRTTIWCWQLLVGGGFLVTGWLLDRRVRTDPAGRARVAVIWTLNPLLLGVLVGGAHLDVVSAAAAIACLAAGTRRPHRERARLSDVGSLLLAGVALGVAAGTKLPYAAAGLAVLWAHRADPPRRLATTTAALAAGAAAVLIPAHLWAGPHVYDQVQRASHYISLGTAWRAVVNGLELVTGPGIRAAIPLAFAGLAGLVLAAVLALLDRAAETERAPSNDPAATAGQRATGQLTLGPERAPSNDPAATALLALATAYLLASPYLLPWYAALAWAPLALLAGGVLERVLLLQLTTLTLAYVPGRVEGVSAGVAALMLDFRTFVAPLITGGLLGWVLVRGLPDAVRRVRSTPSSRRIRRLRRAPPAPRESAGTRP